MGHVCVLYRQSNMSAICTDKINELWLPETFTIFESIFINAGYKFCG